MKLTTLKKASRAMAFELISMLKGGESLTELEIDMLLNFFAPSLPTKKSQIQWVAASTNTNDLRNRYWYVFVKDGRATACNGGLVCWCDTELADGAYDPKTMLPVEIDFSAPDWQRVIGRPVPDSQMTTYDLSLQPKRIITPSAKVKARAVELDGLWFNAEFLNTAARGSEKVRCYVDQANGFVVGADFKLLPVRVD